MAQAAIRDQHSRTVEVNRTLLLKTLRENREKHITEYNEALAGYKDSLLEKMKDAFDAAKVKMEKTYEKKCNEIKSLNDEEIKKQSNNIILVEQQYINMPVPRSYAKEYDAAIAMTEWDVRETLILTQPEFVCFVQDEWDWKEDFLAVSAVYNNKMLK